mmetsp:Transcript_3831/g.11506  ORF Transcript_3831/g.11506 Transcript_3831/m.11506 type:complete len:218 (-) Transcript_3831:495-1148(-)
MPLGSLLRWPGQEIQSVGLQADVGRVVLQCTLRGRFLRPLAPDLGIFDDAGDALAEGHHANRLLPIPLRDHLHAHIRAGLLLVTVPHRVSHADQNVVDAERLHPSHPGGAELIDNTAPAERRINACVAVRRRGDAASALHEHRPVLGETGHHALLEEKHLLFSQAKELITREKIGDRLVGGLPGHHQKPDRGRISRAGMRPRAALEGQDPLRVDLEQ